jgi:FkbM family methyltransferase
MIPAAVPGESELRPEQTARAGAWSKVRRSGRRIRDELIGRGLWGPIDPFLVRAYRVLPAAAHETEALLPLGLRMVLPPNYPDSRVYRDGLYEPELTSYFLRAIRPGWTVIDGGANVGYYTLLASRAVGPGGRVFAFEPDPASYEYLIRNLDANHCHNVSPLRIALSDQAGSFEFEKSRFPGGSHLATGASANGRLIRVETVRLDEFLAEREIKAVHMAKLDIEGAEVPALKGMAGLVGSFDAIHLVVEYNPRALRRTGRSVRDLFSTLSSLGFSHARSLEMTSPPFAIDDAPELPKHVQNLEIWR